MKMNHKIWNEANIAANIIYVYYFEFVKVNFVVLVKSLPSK